jgi:hypothetical protein
MTDVEELLKAKIEAVTALQTHVDAYVTAHGVSSAEGVMRMIATWVDAMKGILPAKDDEPKRAARRWVAGDPDPGSDVKMIRDKDGDLQYRALDGDWTTNLGAETGSWSWSHLVARWGPVTEAK